MAGARGAWCQAVRGGAQNAPGRAKRSGTDWGQVHFGTLSGDVNAPRKMPGVQESPLVPGNAGSAGNAGRAGKAGKAGKD